MTLSRRWVRGAVWVVLLMTGSFLARGQEISGSISGTVVDAAGASVSGAVVTLTNVERSFVERIVKTNKAGYYTASSLPLGKYSATIEMKGFKTVMVSGLTLNADSALRVDQKMEAGAPSESIAVVAPELPLNHENGMTQGLVTGAQVHDLPLVTRNYEQLVVLQPGISYAGTNDQLYQGLVTPAGMGNQLLFSINGERPTANNWTIDGADNVNRGGANPLVPTGNTTALAIPSIDAISQFVTLRNSYEAEYGRNAGGQTDVVTLSGTNAFHGSAYEFFRNDALNANNYFANLAGLPRPELRYNDFGFTAGGPVIIPHYYNGRNKTFFFYSQEFRRVVNHYTSSALVPTAAERNGIFSGAVCAPGGFSSVTGVCSTYTTSPFTPAQLAPPVGQLPTSLSYLNDIYDVVPLPNPAAGQDPHTLTSNARNVFHENQEFARIDETLGTKVNIFYHYLRDYWPMVLGNGLFEGSPALPGVQDTLTTSPSTQHIGHATIAARPNLTIDMGYSYSAGGTKSTPYGLASTAYNSTVSSPISLLPYTSSLGVIPSLTFAGNNVTGIQNAGNYKEQSFNNTGFGDIVKVYKQHTLKFGLSYNHYQTLENATGNAYPYPQGNFTFAPSVPTAAQLSALGSGTVAASPFESEFANLLLGNANGGFTQGSEAITPNLNENLIELYGQDDWRATRKLVVNLGVRYSYFGQPYDVNNELSNFDPAIYNSINQETIASNGNLCTMAGQTTYVTTFAASGPVTTYTLAMCPNVNGLNAYQPNTVADPLNGVILGNPDLIKAKVAVGNTSFPYVAPSGAPAIEQHGSPFGLQVGQAEKHDWAPRIGFAYDVFGNGKTSVRGGYGMVYDASSVSQYEKEVFSNPPYLYVNNYSAVALADPAGNTALVNSGPVLTPNPLYATPIIYKTPYVQQYSLGVQEAFSPTMMIDVSFVGDHGSHLLGIVDINEPTPGQFSSTSIGYTQIPGCSGFTSQACEAPLNQIRPYLGYGAINDMQTIFNSNYNSLQAKFVKKFSGKSVIDANYTYSRSLTDASSDLNSAAQNSYNLNAEYGPSPYNRNNILTVDGIWDLPWYRDQKGITGHIVGGWEVSGIYSYGSGLPLTAILCSGSTCGGTVNYAGLTSAFNGQTNGGLANDAAGLGVLGQSVATLRPDQVLNPSSSNQNNLKTRTNWFNRTAFIAPSQTSFQVGNEKPGSFYGPGFNKLDVGLFRTFSMYHGTSFTLRGEGFNVLNHTNWGSVDTLATSSTFGQVTSARDPRILQVAGKFNF